MAAMITIICGIIVKKDSSKASASCHVLVIYIASGKAIPQYCGSYVSGKRCTTCFQINKINNNGIHHVPVTQKKVVKPFKKGEIYKIRPNSIRSKIRIAPAN